MEAKVQHKDDVIVVNLKGYIDVETALPFREACRKSFASNRKVVFNLEELSFVGSNGIIPFVQTLEILREEGDLDFRFCSVGSEFQKIFSASALNDIEIFNDENEAIVSMHRLTMVGDAEDNVG